MEDWLYHRLWLPDPPRKKLRRAPHPHSSFLRFPCKIKPSQSKKSEKCALPVLRSLATSSFLKKC